jgi:Tol biopolymer transport system component
MLRFAAKRRIAWRLLPLVALITASTFSFAKKGGNGGGNPSEATIYYVLSDEYIASSSDGQNVVVLPVPRASWPSRRLHRGHRWFAFFDEIPGESWPDGKPRYDLFAMRDDGSHVIRLTNQVGLDVWSAGPAADEIWLVEDGLVTFSAIAWDMSTGEPLGAGVYVATVAFDENGNVIGLDEQPDPLSPEIEFPIAASNGFLRPEGSWSWSPDVTAVAWSVFDGNLHVTDLLSDPSVDSVIVTGTAGMPNWSPDGSRIVFHNAGDIDSIRPDGSDWFIVQKRPKAGGHTSTGFSRPRWSPDSRQLAFAVVTTTELRNNHSPGSESDLVIRNADGSGLSVLNPDGGIPTGWR